MIREKLRSFGAVLREERKRRKWTQEKLAFRGRFHVNAVGYLEADERTPSLDTVFRLAKALRLPASTLIAKMEKPSRH